MITNEKVEKLILWIGFSVVISLFPFGCSGLFVFIEKSSVQLNDIFSDGEILIVSAAILADALKDGIMEKTKSWKKLLLIVSTVLLLLFCCILYGIFAYGISESSSDPEAVENMITILSLFLFALSFLTTLSCKIFLEDN